MSGVIYGIPSYRRPECRTVGTLLENGVNAEDIIVSVQTEEDYAEYSRSGLGVTIIKGEADCAAGNRNTILRNCSRPIVLLDDDISSFGVWDGKTYRKDTRGVLNGILRLIEYGQDKTSCIGISPSSNGMVRQGRPIWQKNVLLQGTFLIVFDKSVLFDENFKMLEDYEYSISLVKKARGTLRFNNYVALKPSNGTNKGGMHERYENGEQPKWNSLLHMKHSEYIPNKKNTGGTVKWKQAR